MKNSSLIFVLVFTAEGAEEDPGFLEKLFTYVINNIQVHRYCYCWYSAFYDFVDYTLTVLKLFLLL